ncbi:MAG: 2-succinyl-5-enolpyruvyl-6-hydroxy-3-cyclohexene-1-carboxylic-acid synthase, partial [Chitinophagaceae bacterium]
MILQPINDIAAICALHGIEEAVLCPGSRSAPLTLAFVRHSGIRTRTITDERSAAFIALGIAQQTKKPVVLVCTSGTAALNFAPAIAEAFYQQIPLLVLTADRPPEWIDQHDGQAIKQQNIYGGHVKKSFQVPVDLTHPDAAWHTNRIINEAINLTQVYPAGPTHINVPFREPFYPVEGEVYSFSKNPRIIKSWSVAASLTENCLSQLQEIISQSKRVLVIAGLNAPDKKLQEAINRASQANSLVFIPDITSNLTSVAHAILNPDRILSGIS